GARYATGRRARPGRGPRAEVPGGRPEPSRGHLVPTPPAGGRRLKLRPNDGRRVGVLSVLEPPGSPGPTGGRGAGSPRVRPTRSIEWANPREVLARITCWEGWRATMASRGRPEVVRNRPRWRLGQTPRV